MSIMVYVLMTKSSAIDFGRIVAQGVRIVWNTLLTFVLSLYGGTHNTMNH
jgi:hypothetical protein